LTKIQVKEYRKKYLTERKGNYVCHSYYLYIPKRIAEPLLNKNLRVSVSGRGVLIEPIDGPQGHA